MKLKKGLTVCSSLKTISEQLFVNSGTQAAAFNKGGLKYEDGAHIPKTDWRSLNQREERLLIAPHAEVHYSKNIYIGAIPLKLQKLLEALKLYECVHPDEVRPKFKENEELTKKVTQTLRQFLIKCSSSQDFKYHRITRAIANRDTITCFYEDEKFFYIGLHIDRSTLYDIHTAHKSGNRISINLSQETRTLIFLNLTLIQIFNLLKKKIDTKETVIDPDNIVHYFFKHYPDYPAIKVELKPYQYYVAPTDNFMHDASTLGNKEIDITLVYTGVFDMPEFL